MLTRSVLIVSLFLFHSIMQGATYFVSGSEQDVVGEMYHITTQQGDTLQGLAFNYELGMDEFIQANPKLAKQRILKAGEKLIIPSQYILPPKPFREGIVINVPEKRLYFFKNDHVYTFPVALGRSGWRTPITSTSVRNKKADPTWYVPASLRQYTLDRHGRLLPHRIPPGPSNPLGKFALYLHERSILIHGTNTPKTIGKLVSSGCIRMHNEHVEQLFYHVEVGTPVHIIHHSYKLGRHKGQLLLEAHPSVVSSQYPQGHYTQHDAKHVIDVHNLKDDYLLLPSAMMPNKQGLPTIIGFKKESIDA